MKRLLSPLDVQIELTEACNQACQHCYNYWRGTGYVSGKVEMGLSELVLVVNQLRDAKVGLVTITGGEPMLRKEVLFELTSHVHRCGMEVGFNSNAVLVGDDDAKALSAAGLDHALISLLGPKDLHEAITGPGGDFEATRRGIKSLLGAGIPVAVNMPVSKLNLHVMMETAKLAKEVGVSSFCAGPVVPSCLGNLPLCLSPEECKRCLRELMKISSEFSMRIDVLEPIARCLFNPEEDAEFVRFFGNRTCSAAVSSCAISSVGDMRPCIHSDVIYGNVLREQFLGIWQKMGDWAAPTILPQKCRDCNALIVCEGGCRMSARVISGEYNGCDMYMTNPISDVGRVSILPPRREVVVDEGDCLEFNKRCILRGEVGGYVVYLNGRVEYLTEKGFQFACSLKQRQRFSCSGLSQELGYSIDRLLPVLKRLVETGILLKKKGGEP